VVAKIVNVAKHPKADRLQVVTVEAAENVNFTVRPLVLRNHFSWHMLSAPHQQINGNYLTHKLSDSCH
jgi:hypothetical protein